MPPYTNIPKPTGSAYTNVNPTGKQIFDDINTIFDQSDTAYNGILANVYTNIPKPGGSGILIAGMATGLLIPLTWSKDVSIGNPYIKVSKPT